MSQADTFDFKNNLTSDNNAGVHPKMMEAIQLANSQHAPAYCGDRLTQDTQKLFKQKFGERAETFFVFNGTGANVVAMKSLLNSWESVICSKMAHINNDECAAPEALAGIKLIAIESSDGKITTDQIKNELVALGDQHHAQAKLVSITQPTEVGTLYSLDELKAIGDFCKKHNLYFHIDGARFIHAAQKLKASFKEISQDIGLDILSFGGTKNGLLFGEAVVCFNAEAAKKLKYVRKQYLQLPSKGRFAACQFKALLENDLWREISQEQCQLAQYLEQNIKDIPEIEIQQKVEANSVFVKFPREWTKTLRQELFFYIWDEHSWVARWQISLGLTKNDIDRFVAKLNELSTR